MLNSIFRGFARVLRSKYVQLTTIGFKSEGLCKFEKNVVLEIKEGTVFIGQNSHFGRGSELRALNAEIHIDGDFYCNKDCIISSRYGIRIGTGTRFGENVSVYDHNHVFDADNGVYPDTYRGKPVTIGDCVWIARGAVILSGVNVGKNSVIGPNVVIRNDVPPCSVVLNNN